MSSELVPAKLGAENWGCCALLVEEGLVLAVVVDAEAEAVDSVLEGIISREGRVFSGSLRSSGMLIEVRLSSSSFSEGSCSRLLAGCKRK